MSPREDGLEDMLSRFAKFGKEDGSSEERGSGSFGIGRLMPDDEGRALEGTAVTERDLPMTLDKDSEFLLFLKKGELERDGQEVSSVQRIIHNLSIGDVMAAITSLVSFVRYTSGKSGDSIIKTVMEAGLKAIFDTTTGREE